MPQTQLPKPNLLVKFCGLTQVDDIQTAVSLGVNAIGLVFYPKSARSVSLSQAQNLSRSVPAFVSLVALMVNPTSDEVLNLSDNLGFDLIQFHGQESPNDCQNLAKLSKKRWIKALPMDANTDPKALMASIQSYSDAGASGILLDTYHQDQFGGTGQVFDWQKIPQNSPLPIILAGGLSPKNIPLVRSLPIAGVDVSGGIESTKGKKDPQKMRDFMQALRA